MTDLILLGKGQGKTETLLRRAEALGREGKVAYIVVATQDRARYLSDRILRMGPEATRYVRQPITVREALEPRKVSLWDIHLLFDDLDDILRALIPRACIDTVTWTDESRDEEEPDVDAGRLEDIRSVARTGDP